MDKVLQQSQQDGEEVQKTQILDCREQKEFLGLVSGQEVSGHLEGARNVPFSSIFTADSHAADDEKQEEVPTAEKSGEGAFLLPVEELREVFEVNGVDLDLPIAVVARVPAEAAAVATALLLAGHRSWVAFCTDALTDALVASFPSSTTTDIFHQGRLLYKDDKGAFDLSPQSNDASTVGKEGEHEVEELKKAYNEELSGKASKKRGMPTRKSRKKKLKILCGSRMAIASLTCRLLSASRSSWMRLELSSASCPSCSHLSGSLHLCARNVRCKK